MGKGGRLSKTARRPPEAWIFRSQAGLGTAMRKELHARGVIGRKAPLHALRQRDHDLLFAAGGPLREAGSPLRIPEQILRCLIYGRYKVSKSQLDVLAAELGRFQVPVRLAVSAEGRHFDRRDFRRWLVQRLAERGVASDESGPLTLWVFCVDQAYYLALQTHESSQAWGRDRRCAEEPGSLPPTIAAAMVFLARPAEGERILDPTCGTGTLLAEAACLQPRAPRVGLDIELQALTAAARNLKSFGGGLGLLRADATRTPFPAGAFSLFLANLPFGKQFGDRRDNARLYAAVFDEFKRIGAAEWRAAILTSDTASLRSALDPRPELIFKKLFRVKVRGEWAEAGLVSRR